MDGGSQGSADGSPTHKRAQGPATQDEGKLALR